MLESGKPKSKPPESFCLTLSGGGFRATLFHLGVFRLLYEAGLLPRVICISGVSGGSILAAHLGLQWKRYSGDPAKFEEAASKIIEFTQRDIRNRILRRWILGWLTVFPRIYLKWSRIELLQKEYQLLYGSKKLNELPNVYKHVEPRIMLQCANMTTGMPCTFSRSGLLIYEEEQTDLGLNPTPNQERVIKSDEVLVAYGVAGSSAFPPMFPPLRFDHRLLGASKHEFPDGYDITDGGAYDNLGLDRPLRWFQLATRGTDPADNPQGYLMSDAEGRFSQLHRHNWRSKFALSRNVRATDILMRRVSTLNWRHLSEQHLNIVRVPGREMDEEIATGLRAVESVRTDLDRFSNLEIEALISAGYQTTRSELILRGWIPCTTTSQSSWTAVSQSKLNQDERIKALRKSRFRRWLPLFFAPDDWAWWILVLLAIAPCFL